jgi:ABC-2 type transport system permease protein
MAPALLIAAKDLRQRARDRSLFIIAFIAPLALAFVFNIVFGGLDDGERVQFSFGLVDDDGGELAVAFADVLGSLVEDGLVELTRYDTAAEAREAVADRDVSAAFLVPDGFSDTFATATPVEITVVGNVEASIGTSVARSIARSFATRSSTAALAGLTAASVGVVGVDEIGAVADRVGADPPLAVLVPLTSESGGLDLTTTLVAGLSVFFVFFVAGTAVTGVLHERNDGTLPRLLAAPLPRWSILAGKALSAVAVGIVSLAALMGASTLVMGADWGNPVGALGLCIAAVLAATGIMSLVGGSARNAEQAGNLQSIVAVSMAMLGGSFGLVAPAPDTLWGRLALLTPNRWFLDGLDDLQRGGLTDALPSVAALLGIALITGVIGVRLAGKALRP